MYEVFSKLGTTRCFSHTGSVNHEREEDPVYPTHEKLLCCNPKLFRENCFAWLYKDMISAFLFWVQNSWNFSYCWSSSTVYIEGKGGSFIKFLIFS